MESRFREFVVRHAASGKSLPITHCAPGIRFREIVRSDVLKPHRCEHFGEEVLYFFYGRPAYKTKKIPTPGITWDLPVYFIFDAEELHKLARVYPFDTGAFLLGFFGHLIPPDYDVDDFLLPNSIESAKQIVNAFYGGNKEYYKGSSEKAIDRGNMDFDIHGIQFLAQHGADTAYSIKGQVDERGSAIEIQSHFSIDIGSSLKQLILPEEFLGEKIVQNAIRRWHATDKISSYLGINGLGKDAWAGQIYSIVRNLYEEWGLFDDT